ncbi:MAG: EAL domain-containing protein [Pseudomonadales bacterium]|nr:EAL domain-containing protein [Pseudomonadales bacterium]
MIELHKSGKNKVIRLIAGKDVDGVMSTSFENVDINEDDQDRDDSLYSDGLLNQIINLIPGAVYLRDLEGRFLLVNLAAADLFDCAVEELLSLSGEDASNLLGDGHRHMRDDLKVIENNRYVYLAEEQFVCVRGVDHYFQTTKIPYSFDDYSAAEALLSIGVDITEARETERKLKSKANFDPLTGLGNRNQLRMCLKQALLRGGRTNKPGSLMLLDIDDFREVNEVLGHSTGDELLIQVAAAIKSILPPICVLTHLSGDEFAILLPEIESENDVALLAENIIREIETPFIISENRIEVKMSIGSVFFPADADDYEELFKRVDLALAGAKRKGGDCYCQFVAEMSIAIQRRRTIASELSNAIDKDQCSLHYQPLICASTGELVGMEALMRWEKEGVSVSPVEFIPVAEETGLIVPLGEWVIAKACREMGRWITSNRNIRISINLSTVQFRQKNLVEMVRRLLRENRVAPENIEFEITESTLMEDLDDAVRTMQGLHDMGIHIAIDDFGTGYSSLNYLKRFPINKIKIDRSFIMDIETENDSAAITNAIVSLGHSLGMKVVAEGVENAGQLEFLKNAECDIIQGYYFARPLAGNKFTEWVERREHLS